MRLDRYNFLEVPIMLSIIGFAGVLLYLLALWGTKQIDPEPEPRDLPVKTFRCDVNENDLRCYVTNP